MTRVKKYTEIGYVCLALWALAFLYADLTPDGLSLANGLNVFLVMIVVVTALVSPLLFEKAHKLKETNANTIGIVFSIIVIVTTVVTVLANFANQ